MKKPLEIAIETYQKHGIDFHNLLSWHLCHGIVLSCDDVFLIGYGSKHEKPEEAVQLAEADTFFCTFCAGSMRFAWSLFHKSFKYAAFQREFDGSPRIRVYDSEKLMQKFK